jgi:hypothetical protein
MALQQRLATLAWCAPTTVQLQNCTLWINDCSTTLTGECSSRAMSGGTAGAGAIHHQQIGMAVVMFFKGCNTPGPLMYTFAFVGDGGALGALVPATAAIYIRNVSSVWHLASAEGVRCGWAWCHASCCQWCRTITHMPPEVLRDGGSAFTAAADVYAWGVLLWEMLTGGRGGGGG